MEPKLPAKRDCISAPDDVRHIVRPYAHALLQVSTRATYLNPHFNVCLQSVGFQHTAVHLQQTIAAVKQLHKAVLSVVLLLLHAAPSA